MSANEQPTDLLTLAQAAKRFPSPRSKGGYVSLPSLSRWCRSGIRGPNGNRVRLASIRCGGARYIPSSAIAEFLAALQDAPAADSAITPNPGSGAAFSEAARRTRLPSVETEPAPPRRERFPKQRKDD
jgi:hypothetical protein